MKRIVYLSFALLGLVFTGCNPVEDINSDLAEQADPIIGTDEFTLTSDDYADLVDQGDGEPDFYEMFEAFNTVEEARELVPSLLSDKYPFWGDGSSVTVNFNLFDGDPEDVSVFTGADIYNLESNDYPTSNSNAFLMGENVEMTLEDILSNEFPMPTEGQVVRFGYNKFTEAPEVGLASVYEAAFPADYDDFELVSISGPDALGWTVGSANVQGSGFDGGANAVEEWLISPEIDLSGQTGLTFQITQEIDFLGDPDLIDILISTDYTTGTDPMTATWTALAFDKTIYGSLTTSEDFDFSAYDGANIHVGLKYSSTDSDSPRWRVQDFAIRTTGFSGPTESLSAYYQYTDGSWDDVDGVYYLSAADYDSMGESSGQPGQFNNFSGSVMPQNYLPQFLSMQYPFAQEEDEIFVIYRFFQGGDVGTVTKGNLYRFINGEWTPSISSLQFGLEDGIWVPDNTIRYTLNAGDYGLIVSQLTGIEGFEAAVDNLDSFGNFNRAGGSTNWSDEMILTALNFVLDNLNPSAEEGQKYIVTVATWAPGNSTEDFAVIKEGGEWVSQVPE
ncbi:choice-of-anchor J domain-containing protein [Winogradskyella sp.]|uniref:choice-of-anchor J domain-containing protein n=1 Tax=unclassified Winogradskyella TaxID=2615021 RepID=UPI001AFFA780|nr:choice-of-anchor J domain-containing protein [Winogradskyella sp.]MBO6880868.1 choice-of-anchor J domain-containing protein [Winogradskyella sp.]